MLEVIMRIQVVLKCPDRKERLFIAVGAKAYKRRTCRSTQNLSINVQIYAVDLS